MTKEELFQEFLESSKIDKEDVEDYQYFKQIVYDGKTYEAVGLWIKLKNLPHEITYFYHPTMRLKQWIKRLKDYISN